MRNNIAKHIKTLSLLLLMMLLGGIDAWGQTDFSGTYYIGSRGFVEANTATNYYLCPTEGWAFYKATNDVQAADNGQPFLTTYRCRDGKYDVRKAVWIVEKEPNTGCYYIKQALTGKYMVSNGVLTGAGNTRGRVHLETVADADALDALGDWALFEITYDNNHYDITPHSDYGKDGNNKYLVVNTNNYNQLDGNSIKKNGPTGFSNCGGIIGLYTHPDGGNAYFYLETATPVTPAPTITNNYDGTITITGTGTIYYTTDGTEPTTSSSTYSTAISLTDDITVIRAMAKDDDSYESMVVTCELPKCERPVISVSNGTVTISTTTEGASIRYTTNDTEPTSSSTLYTASFPIGDISTIRAIAVKVGYAKSEEAYYEDFRTVSSSSEITNMQGLYRLASGFTSTSAIGTASAPFTGTIDGQMNTISGLNHPLVAYANGATVKNVMLKDVQISGSGSVGAIAGEASGYTRIYNCGILPSSNKYENESSYVSSSDGYCGGLVGWLKDDSRVINCFSYANITGGTTVAGIVGYNDFASTTKVTGGKYTELKTAIVNCMFYGNITGGTTRYPVYGGNKILNNTATGINNYDFYRAEANLGLADNSHYNCSWPAQEEYLTKYEYYRYLLNSNRELCGWWVGAPSAPSGMLLADVQAVEKDASLMAKWVLDPSIAPYPILKTPGKYYSAINQDPDNRINPVSKTWESRPTSSNTITTKAAPDTEGQKLGSITVTINKGGSLSGSDNKDIPITAMDIENNDFCYGKIQLPYYNSIFGDPNSSDWTTRYGGNYGDKVVVGWEITSVEGGTEGTLVKDWQNGYNFTDRDCTNKDKERIFAQGGYYYVPNGVSAITITAKWANAIYLDNSANNSYDRVYMSGTNVGTDFAPAGHRPTTLGNGMPVQTGTIANNIPTGDVYEKAIVLVGNHQYRVGGADIGNANKGCTIISADFNLDDEPDYCLIWQLGQGTNRQGICPIRLDFLPVIEMGMAMKEDASTQYYSLGCYLPLGHFEVTETSLIHFGQFEFGKLNRTKDAPLILNGGIYDQYCKGTKAQTNAEDHIDYVILGGNVYMPSFSPGAHVNSGAKYPTRHCAVNVLGGRINNLYLTGNFNNGVTPNKDNPHCYIDGGNFKQIAAAAKEGIDGDVYFKINHSVIEEFYGGSTLADKLVTGNINVTVDNSKVTKYCGGPKFGNMTLDANNPANNKTVTTNATGTTFGVYYGGGNGGTSYVQYASTDYINPNATGNYDWDASDRGNLGGYTPNTYRSGGKNYIADYEMEIVNSSTGTDAKKGIFRTYLYAAQFSATNTGPITNNLTDCKVLTSFYGGGNLGGVIGDVESTLTDTEVMGSAFGAGYSASVPEVTIYNKDKTAPTLNVYTGIITPTPDPDPNSTSTTYTWTNKTSLGGQTLSTSKPAVLDVDGVNYFYTEESLENLGTVTGKVTLNIEGTTTVKHSAYGGGEESGVDGNTEVKVTGGTIGTPGYGGATWGNVYGGGKGKDDDAMAGLVKGTSTVTISGSPRIYHNVYGGGAYGSVGTFTYDNTTGIPTALAKEGTGVCNVTIKGGTFGWNGKENGMVFGSSRGDVGEPGGITDKQAWVYSTHVTIGDATAETSPTIKGSVYGSGENGHTLQNTVVDIKKGTIGIATGETITDNNGTPGDTSDDKTYSGADYPYRGNVYGGGCGTDTYWIDANNNETVDDGEKHYNPLAGIVRGNATVTMTGGHVVRNVYGAGAMGSVGTDGVETTGKTTVTISGGRIGVTGEGEGSGNGYVFGAARGESGLDNSYANVRETEVNINYATTPASDNEGKTEQLIAGSVFGGGEAGTVKESVTVNMTSGLILHDIYGGGALADTQTSNWDATKNENAGGWADGKTSASSKTTVNLIGGIVADQVFGGALGAAGKPAYVYGDVLVELNNNNNGETADGTKKGCAVREIFACNNIYGTPKGNATVHIYATQHRGKSQIANADAIGTEGQEGYKPAVTDAKVEGTYDVENVYGGGNQAAYNPASPYTAENTTGAKTQVIIEGCSLSSIKTVYGGGNAAAVPETNVTIKAAYEIQSVFGGGNGKDDIAPGVANPGADVGTIDHDETTYGTGNANTTLEGGVIHEVYGGSNQKGIIKGSINQTTNPDASECELVMSKVVGAGKYADIDGDVNMVLSCQPTSKIDMLFAGADEANVNGNITLTITNGNFGKVFGGNNLGGTVKGKIVVNVKETGCQPIKIDELYLGGNEAPYSVFGYYESNETHEVTGKKILKPRTSATDENLPVNHDGTKYGAIGDFTNYDQPILNVISCTRIGKVFGGGYGSGAVMYADPTVNINMIPGKYAKQIDRDGTDGADNDANALGELVDVFGGGNQAAVIGNPVINIGSETTVDDSPVLGAFITGSVYGGGNKANVDGNTYVNISTKMTSGSTDYTYAAVDHSGTTNYQGISIGASAYGGGCEADVLGNTHVQMSDGYVFNGIFGGGYSGSVGTVTARSPVNYDGTTHAEHDGCIGGKPTKFEDNTGKCTVVVTGGQIGPIEVATEGMKRSTADGGPVPEGWVWGGGCGVLADPATDPDADFRTYVKETDVTIGGTAFILESIIGGGEFGRVLGDTHVTIQDNCQIGVGEGKANGNEPIRYTDEQWTAAANAVTSGDASAIATAAAAMPPCSHYDYGKKVGDKMVYDTYDPYYDKYYGKSSSVPADFANGSTSAPSDGKTWIGCVFGGGSGYMPYEKSDESGYGWLRSAGVVEGNTLVEIKGGHILTNVYGGNEVTDVKGNCTVKMTDGTVGVPRTLDQIKANPLNGNIFGAGKGDPRTYFNTFTNVGSTEVEVTGGIVYGSVYGGGEDGHVIDNAVTTIKKGEKVPVIGCDGTAGNNGNVFGGGKGSATALTAGVVGGNVTLDILDGHIKGSVYGGGEIASVGTYFTNATNPNYGKMQKGDTHGCLDVNLKGGTIHQNVYGGCMGANADASKGVTEEFAAKLGISNNVTVELNNGVSDDTQGCVVKGNIFGCNNVNSSPEGTVTVHIYKTQRAGQTRITNADNVTTAKVAGTKDANGEYDLSTFDVKAVYGGGNMAAYTPKSDNGSTKVIIDGCDRTSIGQVYGGGNAASTPATNVEINGTFEIGELFGGGNGKDKITIDGVEKDNPGANVGYKDYSAVENNPDFATKEARVDGEAFADYRYGTGLATVNVKGGTIHRVFGGSNTKGNVRKTALTMLEEVKENGEPVCDFKVDEAYGGGKSAPMDAEAQLLMACIPGLEAAYGGAEAADIHDDVTLTITNGTFNRVFGGNNLSGTISGKITVNVEETGCRPVVIGELYGGGNLAGYSVYGYKEVTEGGKKVWRPRESDTDTGTGPSTPYADPQVNIRSFTSIGTVYGGGYGEGALMVGNPTVNINESVGTPDDYPTTGDYDTNGFKGKTLTIDGHEVVLPSHTKNKIGAINNVFGGGNAARVIGNTNVNIATESTQTYVSVDDDPDTTDATENVKTVIGADIRGNVYGGGNNAEVTGNTNVNIGKRSDQ